MGLNSGCRARVGTFFLLYMVSSIFGHCEIALQIKKRGPLSAVALESFMQFINKLCKSRGSDII